MQTHPNKHTPRARSKSILKHRILTGRASSGIGAPAGAFAAAATVPVAFVIHAGKLDSPRPRPLPMLASMAAMSPTPGTPAPPPRPAGPPLAAAPAPAPEPAPTAAAASCALLAASCIFRMVAARSSSARLRCAGGWVCAFKGARMLGLWVRKEKQRGRLYLCLEGSAEVMVSVLCGEMACF